MSDPMDAWLRQQQAAAIAVLRAGLPQTKHPEQLTQTDWEQLGANLLTAIADLLRASTALRQLPRTTACVCPACKNVVLPEGPGGKTYTHCSQLWMLRPLHLPLPPEFWETARPGQAYEGAIAALWATEEEQHGSQEEKHRRGARSARKAAG